LSSHFLIHFGRGQHVDTPRRGAVIRGGYALGPEMAAGWLWSTPTDLLRWAAAIDPSA
jgi:hypothetical protein